MSAPVIPEERLPLVTTDRHAVIATVRPDGSPATATVWIDWDGEHLRISTRVGSVKGRNVRADPRVACHVHDRETNTWLAMRGRVVDIHPDEDLALIDVLSNRYRGVDYPVRTEREVFVIELEHVRASG